jgi:tripartite-type tricarboxylate transporter receptor subunit TctC
MRITRAARPVVSTLASTLFRALGLALTLMAGGHAGNAFAQAYPTKPVRVVVPAPPGGLIDTVARVVSQQLTERMGQQFIVENRAGASGTMGSQVVARSAPDGYTLMVHASQFVITPMLMKNVTYSTTNDFTPISRLGSVPLVIVTGADVPANNLREFLALCKASPGKYSFGISGVGSIGHLAVERIRAEQKLNVLVIPYNGLAPASVALLGGQVSAMIDPVPALNEHVTSGRIKALAVTSSQRSSLLPNVPTAAESGIGDFDMGSWYGLWGPAGLPPDIVARLAKEVALAMSNPRVVEKLAAQGLIPIGSTPQELADTMKAEIATDQAIIRDASIMME